MIEIVSFVRKSIKGEYDLRYNQNNEKKTSSLCGFSQRSIGKLQMIRIIRWDRGNGRIIRFDAILTHLMPRVYFENCFELVDAHNFQLQLNDTYEICPKL